MISSIDLENITKARDGASLLVSDLQAIATAKSPLLAELGVDMLKTAVELEQKLQRLALLSQDT